MQFMWRWGYQKCNLEITLPCTVVCFPMCTVQSDRFMWGEAAGLIYNDNISSIPKQPSAMTSLSPTPQTQFCGGSSFQWNGRIHLQMQPLVEQILMPLSLYNCYIAVVFSMMLVHVIPPIPVHTLSASTRAVGLEASWFRLLHKVRKPFTKHHMVVPIYSQKIRKPKYLICNPFSLWSPRNNSQFFQK